MTYIRVKGFQIFKDRHGKPRCYHRATRTPVDLLKYPIGTEGFFAQCSQIAQLQEKGNTAKPGTLGRLIKEYRAHIAFQDLASRTKSDYQRCFDYLQPISDTPLHKFNSQLVVRIRDKAAQSKGRRFGTYVKAVLSVLFAWGKERGFVASNPAQGVRGIRRPKDAPEANRPWSDDERHAVLDALPQHMMVPVALMMYCGLDPQDALSLQRSAITEGQINTKRRKTGEPVWVPLPTGVIAALQNAAPHDATTVCANSYGRPWTVSGFRASWRRVKCDLELKGKVRPGLTLKGLRHTVATILSEMGYGPETIRIMLGQKTDAMARHYSRRANHKKQMAGVIENFDSEMNNRGTNFVKPASKAVKP